MKYERTKEQILEAHRSACSDLKKKIESWFPDVFKSKLEVGKWYKNNHTLKFCITEIEDYKIYGYGECSGMWFNKSLCCYDYDEDITPCNNFEVSEMLIKEAKKRYGSNPIKNGTCFKTTKGLIASILTSVDTCWNHCKFSSEYNRLEYYGFELFYNGKWAEIVEQPKEYTLKQLEQKLGEKIKIVG